MTVFQSKKGFTNLKEAKSCFWSLLGKICNTLKRIYFRQGFCFFQASHKQFWGTAELQFSFSSSSQNTLASKQLVKVLFQCAFWPDGKIHPLKNIERQELAQLKQQYEAQTSQHSGRRDSWSWDQATPALVIIICLHPPNKMPPAQYQEITVPYGTYKQGCSVLPSSPLSTEVIGLLIYANFLPALIYKDGPSLLYPQQIRTISQIFITQLFFFFLILSWLPWLPKLLEIVL